MRWAVVHTDSGRSVAMGGSEDFGFTKTQNVLVHDQWTGSPC